jgi:hypothetical protein
LGSFVVEFFRIRPEGMMGLDEIWDAHLSGTDPGQPGARSAEEHFYDALLARSRGDDQRALVLCLEASRQEPSHALYTETSRFLDYGSNSTDVYRTSAAFTAFASGGGNTRLYPAAHEALRQCYAELGSIRLLDIGTGEGHGLLPALTPEVTEIDTVEPAAERLALVTAELDRRGTVNRAHAMTVQEFMTHPDAGPWDLVQETFALHTVSRADRLELFRWLRSRTAQIALVEFDVPDLGSGLQPARFRYLRDRYECGIREYSGSERALVAQGFLVPLLLNTLCGGGGQEHAEQPIDWWAADLRSAGFEVEAPKPIFDYWWATAHLVRGT